MHAIHPNARTTPAVRAEIARSSEPTGVLARRFGVSTETIRKWRKRGPQDCQDRSARPHKLPWKATEEERAIVCALRRATGFPLDDLTFVVTHFLPHLNRDAVYRILKAEGLNRLPAQSRSRKPDGAFKAYGLGFVHVDVKHLPKLRDREGVTRKRFLFVAIDRCSRCTGLSRTMRPPRAPSPSSTRPSRRSPSRSRTSSPTEAHASQQMASRPSAAS